MSMLQKEKENKIRESSQKDFDRFKKLDNKHVYTYNIFERLKMKDKDLLKRLIKDG